MATSAPSRPGRGLFPFQAAVFRRVPAGVRSKQRIVRQLIEERLSLLEAVGRFRQIHRNCAAELERELGCSTAPTDTEGLCRAVIGWVGLELSDRPDLADSVSDRLETEMRDFLERPTG